MTERSVDVLSFTPGRTLSNSGSPFALRTGSRPWYSAVTPASLYFAAMVPNTGMSSGDTENSCRLRCSCFATSLRASSAPLRSNLLMATASAKSSISIFSNWLAAPNSGVITYKGISTRGTIPASPCPIPGVSTIIKSYPVIFTAFMISGRYSGISVAAERVAMERMNTVS